MPPVPGGGIVRMKALAQGRVSCACPERSTGQLCCRHGGDPEGTRGAGGDEALQIPDGRIVAAAAALVGVSAAAAPCVPGAP